MNVPLTYVIGKKDFVFLPFIVVMCSLVSSPDQLCLEVSVNRTQGLFGSGIINIGLLVSAALIVSEFCWQHGFQLKVVFFFVSSVWSLAMSLKFAKIFYNRMLVLLCVLFPYIVSAFPFNVCIPSLDIRCPKYHRCLSKKCTFRKL